MGGEGREGREGQQRGEEGRGEERREETSGEERRGEEVRGEAGGVQGDDELRGLDEAELDAEIGGLGGPAQTTKKRGGAGRRSTQTWQAHAHMLLQRCVRGVYLLSYIRGDRERHRGERGDF